MFFHDIDKFVKMQLVAPPVADLTSGAVIPASGSFIDVSEFAYFAFLLILGATDRTVQKIQIQQAATISGTPKDITGAVNTALVATDDNKMALITVRASALDTANGYKYVTALPTWTGGSAGLGTILFFGWRANEVPVTQPAAFSEVVRV